MGTSGECATRRRVASHVSQFVPDPSSCLGWRVGDLTSVNTHLRKRRGTRRGGGLEERHSFVLVELCFLPAQPLKDFRMFGLFSSRCLSQTPWTLPVLEGVTLDGCVRQFVSNDVEQAVKHEDEDSLSLQQQSSRNTHTPRAAVTHIYWARGRYVIFRAGCPCTFR